MREVYGRQYRDGWVGFRVGYEDIESLEERVGTRHEKRHVN